MWFCTFDATGGKELQRHPLTKTGAWHRGFFAKVKPGTRYGLRADGPWVPEAGHRFDVSKLLLDPCATEIDRPFAFHPALAERGRDTAIFMPKGIIRPPHNPVKRKPPRKPGWIYELQVKAFTMRHPDVPEHVRGTVAALRHPTVLKHLKLNPRQQA